MPPSFVFVLLFAALAASIHVGRTKEGVTPVSKVLDMMKEMLDKAKDEKHKEQIQFAGFKQFCDSTSAKRTKDISSAAGQAGSLAADIEGYVAKAKKSNKANCKIG